MQHFFFGLLKNHTQHKPKSLSIVFFNCYKIEYVFSFVFRAQLLVKLCFCTFFFPSPWMSFVCFCITACSHYSGAEQMGIPRRFPSSHQGRPSCCSAALWKESRTRTYTWCLSFVIVRLSPMKRKKKKKKQDKKIFNGQRRLASG